MSDIIASLELVEGVSGRSTWTFARGTPRAVVRIGSGEHCNWVIEGPQIQANHLMLIWDGKQLTAVDTGAGDVTIDGKTLQASEVLVSCRLEFGSAAIVVQSAGAPVIAGNAEPLVSRASDETAAAPARPPNFDATLIATPATATTPATPALAAPASDASAADSPTTISGPPADMTAGAPAPGASAPVSSATHSPGAGYDPDATTLNSPQSGPGYDPDATNYAPPRPPGSPMPAPALAEPPVAQGGQFAEPPPQAAEARRHETVGSTAEKSNPVRLVALLAATIALGWVALFTDLLGPTPPPAAGTDRTGAATTSGSDTPAATADSATAAESDNATDDSRAPTGGTRRGDSARPKAAETTPANAASRPRPAALDAISACDAEPVQRRKAKAKPCPTADRIAADLAASGRYAAALEVYSYLAQQEPDGPYEIIAEVLRRKLASGPGERK